MPGRRRTLIDELDVAQHPAPTPTAEQAREAIAECDRKLARLHRICTRRAHPNPDSTRRRRDPSSSERSSAAFFRPRLSLLENQEEPGEAAGVRGVRYRLVAVGKRVVATTQRPPEASRSMRADANAALG